MSVPDPLVVTYGADSRYFAEHRRYLVKLTCPTCGHSVRAEVEPPPVPKGDWSRVREAADMERKAGEIVDMAHSEYRAHRCAPRGAKQERADEHALLLR